MSEIPVTPHDGIIVIGGGISGITAAVEAAEAGHDVILLEREPYLGGRVARMNEYFPKLCPPSCGLEINFRRIKQNPRIKVLTLSEVKSIQGEPGAYQVKVLRHPRRINDNCTLCNKCVEICPVDRPDDFNYGLSATKAIYLPHAMAYPMSYVIDEKTCLGQSCAKCIAYCPFDAIDLGETSKEMVFSAGGIVVATGWKPYDATRLTNLGFGRHADVITNTMMERLASKTGPTGGQIRRPSDNGPIRRVAFVQCAGSRDEHHLNYCSTVCCTASFKQASYVRKQYPEAEIHIFYIDIRTMGTLEDFYLRIAQEDPKIFLHKGKVAQIDRTATGQLVVVAEEILSGQRLQRQVDLAVLATGMQPEAMLGKPVPYDHYGFVTPSAPAGLCGAGCAKRPVDVASAVQDATGGALRAIQGLRR